MSKSTKPAVTAEPPAEFLITLKLRPLAGLPIGEALTRIRADLSQWWAPEDAVVIACCALNGAPALVAGDCNHAHLHPMRSADGRTVCLGCGNPVQVMIAHQCNGRSTASQGAKLRAELDDQLRVMVSALVAAATAPATGHSIKCGEVRGNGCHRPKDHGPADGGCADQYGEPLTDAAQLFPPPESVAPLFSQATPATVLTKGQRVRFLKNDLGAVPGEFQITRYVPDNVYGVGDEGIVAFKHPNQKPAPKGCKGWWFVEVDSKAGAPRKLYVAVPPHFVTVIS